MPIDFRCTQCQKLLQAPDETAGKRAQCPQCGAAQLIPGPSVPPAGAAPSVSPGNPFAPGTPGLEPADEANPYRSPADCATARRFMLDAEYLHAYAADRVNTPATMLILTGGLGFVGSLGWFASVLLATFLPGNNPSGDATIEELLMFGGLGILLALAGLAISSVIILGGLKMKNLESRAWAMAGAILAAIPGVSPCWCLGTPFGIWSLVVLNDHHVCNAFRS